MTSQVQTRRGVAMSVRMLAGAAGGLAGGAVFGLMMQLQDMLGMVAMLVGSESIAVGWAVHLGISAVLGVGFGLVAAKGLDAWAPGVALGVGYGMLWWVLGALLAMPARLGMPVLTVDSMAWQSLLGHIAYGAILGVVAVAVVRAGRRGA